MSERQSSATTTTAAGAGDQRRWIPRWSRAVVQLIGRVGADPDIRFASEASGPAWARFRVATEVPHGADDAPDWHTVIARDRLAQFAARYITTGRLVHVIGWLTYRTVETRDGAHVVAEIRASEVLLLDRPTRFQAQDVPKP